MTRSLGLVLLSGMLLGGCGSCEGCGGAPALEPPLDAAIEVAADPEAALDGDAGTPDASRQVVVRSAVGEVVIGRDGGWRPATEGARIETQETVRTSIGGRATVELGEGSALDLGQATEVTITSIDADRASVRLQRGRLGADLGGETALQVEGAGSSTVATARKGRMSVYANGRGLVAVAAESAEVELSSPTGKTLLGTGEQAVVQGESAPDVTEIPKEVFLNVAWPEETATRHQTMELEGKVQPGSSVRVNGAVASIDQSGRFRIQVPLREGRNALKVIAEDPLGREVQRTQAVTLRRQAPEVTAETEALWK